MLPTSTLTGILTAPNIFDKNYARKTAYKGVCDGIAGKDISEDFTGDMWMNGK